MQNQPSNVPTAKPKDPRLARRVAASFNLEQEHWCLHCSQKFSGLAARVWKDEDGSLWLECGTPGCDGSPIDWAPYPWWDPRHPATREYLKKEKAGAKKPKRKRRGKADAADDDVPF
jgi:hypothetical protein